MSRCRMSGRGRGTAALLVLGSALVAAVPSCVGVLGLDAFGSAPVELCELIDRCYGADAVPECYAHVAGGLDGSEPRDARGWLTTFADHSCLENCTTARRCLDLRPVCDAIGASCDALEKCCGFSKGLAACGAEIEQCCRPKGTPCAGDDDCCGDAGRCDEGTKTCGGVVCKQQDEPCADSAECCTKICRPEGTCSDTVCDKDGASCDSELSCCSGVCEDGTCGFKGCGNPGTACSGPMDCCPELVCFLAAEGQGVCSFDTCTPDGLPCAAPGECCSGYCSPDFLQCAQPPVCQPPGASCGPQDVCCSGGCVDGTCGCVPDFGPCAFPSDCCSGKCDGKSCTPAGCGVPGAGCGTDDDCCSGTCNGGICTWTCNGQAPIDCGHDVCQTAMFTGTVLDPSCQVDTACVLAVCAFDNYCCCIEWDDICVGEVPDHCDHGCP